MEPSPLVWTEFRRIMRRRRLQRQSRVYRERCNVSELTDQCIFEMTRLNREALHALYAELEPYLEPSSTRGHAIGGLCRLVACLQFFANGSFQRLGAVASGISQPSMSRILVSCLKGMRAICHRHINLPNSHSAWNAVKMSFFYMGGIPNVMAAIDCTHVALVPPTHTEHLYRNRKMGHSLNIQIVCGPNMEIFNVVAGFPGSCHDAHIFRNSEIYLLFENGDLSGGWLLGDAGYPCLPWLLTPVSRPSTASEEAYNKAHGKMRSVVERTFGLLKMRFRCLDATGGALQYQPAKVAEIVVACAVLHNFALQHNVAQYPLQEYAEDPVESESTPDTGSQQGRIVRQELISNYFV